MRELKFLADRGEEHSFRAAGTILVEEQFAAVLIMDDAVFPILRLAGIGDDEGVLFISPISRPLKSRRSSRMSSVPERKSAILSALALPASG